MNLYEPKDIIAFIDFHFEQIIKKLNDNGLNHLDYIYLQKHCMNNNESLRDRFFSNRYVKNTYCISKLYEHLRKINRNDYDDIVLYIADNYSHIPKIDFNICIIEEELINISKDILLNLIGYHTYKIKKIEFLNNENRYPKCEFIGINNYKYKIETPILDYLLFQCNSNIIDRIELEYKGLIVYLK